VWREGSGWYGDFEVNTTTYQFSVNLSSLLDGRYDVTVEGNGGDFYIDGSKLWIKYEAKGNERLGGTLVGFEGYSAFLDTAFSIGRVKMIGRGSPIKRPLSRAKTFPTQEKMFFL